MQLSTFVLALIGDALCEVPRDHSDFPRRILLLIIRILLIRRGRGERERETDRDRGYIGNKKNA